MTNYYVYEYTRLDTNEVFYIGKGVGNRYKTISNRNKYFKRIVKSTAYKVEKILEDLSEVDAFEAEVSFIAYRKSIGQASCNFTNGGEGSSGYKHSEESKSKIGDASKGNLYCLGSKNHNTKHSEESKQKISEAVKGKVLSEEHKQKISDSNKGKRLSDDHKKILSDIKKGKSLSDEHKKALCVPKKTIPSSTLKGRPWSNNRRMAHNNKGMKNE